MSMQDQGEQQIGPYHSPHKTGAGWKKKTPSVAHAVNEEVKKRLFDSAPKGGSQLAGTKTDGD